MATPTAVKPTQKALQTYYADLQVYADQGVDNESALRSAFQKLLEDTGRRFGWSLIAELAHTIAGKTVQPDATFRDEFRIRHGHWEAKDTKDNLEVEIQKKIAKGYPLTNIIFEDTRQAYLYQKGRQAMKVDLTQPRQLADLLNAFFSFAEPAHEDFNKAVEDFKERVPDLARGLVAKIQEAHQNNRRFQEAFAKFYDLCKTSLNPNLSQAAVDEMLVQHLLTERLIRTIFERQDFIRRNVIAAEVEKVIDALVSQSFSRHEFLRSLDLFYVAIEAAAATIESFTEKQHFLNVVYERFFQGYSVKVADTMGIIYTPQEIVDFMCASVEEVLKREFNTHLGAPGVNILDPCTGTGNFIVNFIRRIPKRDLPRMYREQLFANEVMLLPYYIAALNIEHAYGERAGEYEPFPGLCFVDTLDLAEGEQRTFGFMTEENIARVERQKRTPITVIIGNPPYNAHQLNENDNNKNRTYATVDGRVQISYSRDSSATLKAALVDPYVKFFRWATDRLGERDGILAFVSNNSFLDQRAFDGMRKHLESDFDSVYHIDLNGNVRHNPKLSGTTHNVFGIQVGVGITLAVRRRETRVKSVRFYSVPEQWRRERKLSWLSEAVSVPGVQWTSLAPDSEHNWLITTNLQRFRGFLQIAASPRGAPSTGEAEGLLLVSGPGVNSSRDRVLYAFAVDEICPRVERFCDDYNGEVERFFRKGSPKNVDDFLDYSKLKWSSTLKLHLGRGTHATFDTDRVVRALYRPFGKRLLYYDDILIDRPGIFRKIFGTGAEEDNWVIALTNPGSEKPFMALIADTIVDYHLVGAGCGAQCFPFYLYDEDGSHRRENVTDWALKHFRGHYGKKKITKWDIFYYVYGILHHPGYRERFAENLKRELPWIPLAPDFRAFATAGQQLARLHLDYEKLEPWPLQWIETPGVPLSYRVEKMRLNKEKTALKVNDSLTLGGIPPEVFEYRLGNRSALEWVIDQYRVTEDKRSGIRSDPNRPDDPEYIVRLVGQVVRVSLETVKIVRALPADFGAGGH